jgi:hypothetical protein
MNPEELKPEEVAAQEPQAVAETVPDVVPEEVQPEPVEEPLPGAIPEQGAEGDVTAELEELREYKKRNQEANKIIIDVLEEEPLLALILSEVSKGASLLEAIALHIDTDDLKLEEGMPDYDKWKKNTETRKQNRSERDAFMSELTSNREASVAEIKQFAEENELSEEEASDFLQTLNDILTDAYKGKLTKTVLNRLYKGSKYDKDINNASTQAEEQGKIAGRNEKIEATMGGLDNSGDGLPDIAAMAQGETESGKEIPGDDWVSKAVNRSRKPVV